jgi:hypothetical protein
MRHLRNRVLASIEQGLDWVVGWAVGIVIGGLAGWVASGVFGWNGLVVGLIAFSSALVSVLGLALIHGWPKQADEPEMEITVGFDRNDPVCYQPGGTVFRVGSDALDETLYRLAVSSVNALSGCRVILKAVSPGPHDPGAQRLGLAMRPRIPITVNSGDFTVNAGGISYVEVLLELSLKLNPTNQPSEMRMVYANQHEVVAKRFEHDDYVLTFHLEGPTFKPVPLHLGLDTGTNGANGLCIK